MVCNSDRSALRHGRASVPAIHPLSFVRRWPGLTPGHDGRTDRAPVFSSGWVGGSSDAAIKRALRMDGWHGSRISAEQAAATVKRLRAERPEEAFTLSLRVICNAHTVGDMRDAPRADSDAGIQHIMAAPEDRDINTYLVAGWRHRPVHRNGSDVEVEIAIGRK